MEVPKHFLSKPHWMPFHVERWLTSQGIRALEPLAELAFLKLLMWSWSTETCTIPDDESKLKALSGIGSAWKRVAASVREFWRPHPTLPGRLFNEFQMEKRMEQEEIWLQKRDAGERSVRSRASQPIKDEPDLEHPEQAPVPTDALTAVPTAVERPLQRPFNGRSTDAPTAVTTDVTTPVQRPLQRPFNHPHPHPDDDDELAHTREDRGKVLIDPGFEPEPVKRLQKHPWDFGRAKALEVFQRLQPSSEDLDAWLAWEKTHGTVAVRVKVQKYKHPSEVPKDVEPQRGPVNLGRRSSFAKEGKFSDPKFNQSSK